jgi:hypothetical protein
MKHKFLVVSLLGLIGFVPATQAQAQNFVTVKGLTPFTPPANFMSLPGYLRWRYLIDGGRWISRAEAVNAVHDQGLSARLDPTDWRHAARLMERQAARDARPRTLIDLGF